MSSSIEPHRRPVKRSFGTPSPRMAAMAATVSSSSSMDPHRLAEGFPPDSLLPLRGRDASGAVSESMEPQFLPPPAEEPSSSMLPHARSPPTGSDMPPCAAWRNASGASGLSSMLPHRLGCALDRVSATLARVAGSAASVSEGSMGAAGACLGGLAPCLMRPSGVCGPMSISRECRFFFFFGLASPPTTVQPSPCPFFAAPWAAVVLLNLTLSEWR
mmetsp:Transcript_50865/g.119202  ORF Transcript_50865/g.119202 Transcript_50865/m.119202 type:complete len:216 (+) Transcript_50865:1889-2536(+)